MITFKEFISEMRITGFRRTDMGQKKGSFGGGGITPEDTDLSPEEHAAKVTAAKKI